MIIAEIKKNLQVYRLQFPEGENGYTLQQAYERAVDVAEGREVYLGDDQILDLGPGNKYDHIRVWREEDLQPDVVEHELPDPKEFPQWTEYEVPITYLGQKLKVRCILYYEGPAQAYLLITSINDMPPLEVLSHGHANTLTITVASQSVPAYVHVTPIVPKATLADHDVIPYIEDYIDACKKSEEYQPKQKTARAFLGWNTSLGADS
jgi:hypothetical protein